MATLYAKDWELAGVKGVLFDKDGTLIDSHLYWGKIIENRARAVSDRYGLKDSLFADLCLSMGYSREQRRLIPEGPVALVGRERVIAAVKEFLHRHGAEAETEELESLFVKVHKEFQKEAPTFLRILPGVEKLLKKLKDEKVLMAVVTSDALKNTREVLEALKVFSFFPVIIGRESTAESKESGVPAKVAVSELGIDPQAAVAIGDAPVDVVMAQQAGLQAAVAVATGQVPYEKLRALTPFTLRYFEELSVKK